jgi:hypothetical protein
MKTKYNKIIFLTVACLIVLLNLGCAKKEDNGQPSTYLGKWIGTYEGTSYHWSSYPVEIDGLWQYITNDSYKNVSVEVRIGSQDSCLNFLITYNDSINDTNADLLFSNLGVHFSQWGVGSGYGSLNISFESDSMHYNYFQKCGMPCTSGIEFDIKKIY